VVSFDKDGSLVSSVDLAKYGLSMPVITPKPDKYYRGEYKIVFPHEADTAQTGGMNSNTVPKVKSSPTIRINEKKQYGNILSQPPLALHRHCCFHSRHRRLLCVAQAKI
jgi:hypothetical protein